MYIFVFLDKNKCCSLISFLFSQDGNGTIENEELRGFLKDLLELVKKDYDATDLKDFEDTILKGCDFNRDGKINKKELTMILLALSKQEPSEDQLIFSKEKIRQQNTIACICFSIMETSKVIVCKEMRYKGTTLYLIFFSVLVKIRHSDIRNVLVLSKATEPTLQRAL